jgi:hypothetical protein
MTAKTITPGTMPDIDGKEGKFNASTEYDVKEVGGTPFHRTLYLRPTDLNGTPISVGPGESIAWDHDFDASEVRTVQENIIEITTNAVGVHNVSATYQGYTSVNKVVVVPRLVTGDQRYYGCALKISDYDEASSSPDITFNYSNFGDKSYTLDAPNGLAVLQITDATYLDRDARQAFCDLASIPGDLNESDYQTSLIIPADKSVLCIARDAAGGHAKILFSQGLNCFYAGLDTYIEYIGAGQTEFVCHY